MGDANPTCKSAVGRCQVIPCVDRWSKSFYCSLLFGCCVFGTCQVGLDGLDVVEWVEPLLAVQHTHSPASVLFYHSNDVSFSDSQLFLVASTIKVIQHKNPYQRKQREQRGRELGKNKRATVITV